VGRSRDEAAGGTRCPGRRSEVGAHLAASLMAIKVDTIAESNCLKLLAARLALSQEPA
jgi:hypothetical protein